MVYKGIGFNEGHWKTKTEAEFIEHEGHHGLSVKQLKEAFSIMNPVKKDQPVNTGRASKKAE